MQAKSLVEFIGGNNWQGAGVRYNVLPKYPEKGDIATVSRVSEDCILVDEFQIVPIPPRIVGPTDGFRKTLWKEIQEPMEVSDIVADAIENYSTVEIKEYA